MAGYDYERNYKGNQNNWTPPHSKEWTKPRKPVIIDSEGKKRAIISYSPPNSHTLEGHYREKIIEHVHYTTKGPVIQEHKIHPHHENYKDNSYTRPVVHHHVNGENYTGSDPYTRSHQHAKYEDHKKDRRHGSHEHKIHSQPKHEPYIEIYKESRPHHNNDNIYHNRHANNEYQDYDHHSFHMPTSPEARRPSKFGLLSATNWRNLPNKYQGSREEESKLSSVTDNIGEAMGMLKEAAAVYGHKESVNNREPARRYGSLTPSSRIYVGDYEHQGPTASKKYNGTHAFPG